MYYKLWSINPVAKSKDTEADRRPKKYIEFAEITNDDNKRPKLSPSEFQKVKYATHVGILVLRERLSLAQNAELVVIVWHLVALIS